MGFAVDNMFQLGRTAFWPLIFVVPILFAGVFLFVWGFDRLIDRMFPSGVRARDAKTAKERRPLALLLSLPSGVVIGLIAAQFGLADLLL